MFIFCIYCNYRFDVFSYSTVTVSVPNTYTSSDEGKVVSNGGLVSQTSTTATTNGTIDTTTNNSVTVNVANSYTAQDEGKVVSNGALVAQGSDTVTQNGIVDTTLISSLTANVSGGGSIAKLTPIDNGNIRVAETEAYLIEQDNYIYFVGSIRCFSSTTGAYFSIPSTFDLSKIGSRRNESTYIYLSSSGVQRSYAGATINASERTIFTDTFQYNYILTFIMVVFEKSS